MERRWDCSRWTKGRSPRSPSGSPRALYASAISFATSSIDTETEQLIQRAIERVMRDRTSIVVAHRLSTIQNADRIIVLHHGEIREQGTHQELLAERGLYWKLYKLQYADSRSVLATD